MITLVVEDGSGLETANSYVSVEFADSYHESSTTGAAWALKSNIQKQQGLISASRTLDQQFQWDGWKRNRSQALQWPRIHVIDPDITTEVYPRTMPSNNFLPEDEVPAPIKRATAALALILLTETREKEADGKGLSQFALDGVFSVTFDLSTRPDVVPEWMMSELSKYGRSIGSRSGTVKLSRA